MTEQKVLDSRLYFDQNPLVLEVLGSLPKTLWKLFKHLLMWSNLCSCLTHLSNLQRLENCPAVNTRRGPGCSNAVCPACFRNKLFVFQHPAAVRQMDDPSRGGNMKFFKVTEMPCQRASLQGRQRGPLISPSWILCCRNCWEMMWGDSHSPFFPCERIQASVRDRLPLWKCRKKFRRLLHRWKVSCTLSGLMYFHVLKWHFSC